MSDYIKREDAIKALEGWKISGEMILGIIPSADVVEVVRCKDCKYKHARKESGKSPIFCDFGIGNQLDDFCSYGERAEA